MSPRSDVVENYLDELLAGLRGNAAAVRRMLTETEEHLYAAIEADVACGMDPEDAAQQAIARFGAPDRVGRAWSASAPPEPLAAFARRVVGQLIPLGGVGLVAIGISGVLARLMTALWGRSFVFADPPGARYSASDCQYWLSLRPNSGSCANAYLAEAVADGLQARYVAGILGLITLAIVAIRRRRRGLPVLMAPPVLTSFTGAALFLAATAALIGLGTDAMRISGGNGAGQWLSGAVIAFPVAIAYGVAFLRSGRRAPLPG